MKGEDIEERHHKYRVRVGTNHIFDGGPPGKEC